MECNIQNCDEKIFVERAEKFADLCHRSFFEYANRNVSNRVFCLPFLKTAYKSTCNYKQSRFLRPDVVICGKKVCREENIPKGSIERD